MKRIFGILVVALGLTCALFPVEAQQSGGAFVPGFNYDIAGVWNFSGGAPTVTGSGTLVSTTATQTLTNKTLTAPTLTAVTITGTSTIGNGMTITTPVLSGSVTGTYTLAGTPTITAPTITTPTMSSITNTGTLTLPSATGGVPVALDCGATGVGNQTCSAVAATAATKVYAGSSTMSSNAAVITFPVAFAATTSYQCVANDITTRANPVQMVSTSTTTATITNTTGASDVINWICVGQ